MTSSLDDGVGLFSKKKIKEKSIRKETIRKRERKQVTTSKKSK